jgi:ATP-dependent Clp protease adaptor protein ClpS
MAKVKTGNNASVEVLDRVTMQAPKMWNVILYNDDKTTMEFVILVLMQIFHKSFDDASEIMMNIHETGRGIAGTYSNEVATQKRDETIAAARSNNFPLNCEIEIND